MSPDLHDKTWMDCGISLSWDAEALNEICSPESVRSLREFMRLHEAQWPEDELKLINNRTQFIPPCGIFKTMSQMVEVRRH
jgi:hypothetical protein